MALGVKVLTDTVVHRVNFADQVASGVELTDGRKITSRKEVILCTGTYRTPQVLMLSGIGPSASLTQQGIPIVFESPDDATLLGGIPIDWVVSQPLTEEITTKHEPRAAERNRNLYETLVVYMPPGIPGIPVDGTHIPTSTMLLLPTSHGSVLIRSSIPEEPPVIQTNYFSTLLDRDALVHRTRETLKLMLETGPMKLLIDGESPPAGDGLLDLTPLLADIGDVEIEERIRRTGMQHHHSGETAAMGKVVDAEGKVLGVKGLRVADAIIVLILLGGHPQSYCGLHRVCNR
ncbi:hypothetical protein QQS21_003920 [Conoideocrella luteorostrata]|uniref:Glucose-methanol-choline oxidoreductase N-terminal domain-containing protein n=1 Tax=Conoideocrella luteorostrata TaxID=1105319 RepID=A0AAJ0CTC1_9HYPO|nr:hypothetical protein QQS21_003920 [Conoideocrella luteorostrata]